MAREKSTSSGLFTAKFMSNKPIISNISIFFTLEGWAIWGLCSSVFVQRITLWFPNWRPQGPAAALEGLLTSPETSSLTKHRRTKIHCAWLPYKNGIMKWAKLRPKMVPSLCRGSFQIAPLGGVSEASWLGNQEGNKDTIHILKS